MTSTVSGAPKRTYSHFLSGTHHGGPAARGGPGAFGAGSSRWTQLKHAPEDISLERMVRLFQGPLAPIDCATRFESEFCPMDPGCSLKRTWAEVRDVTRAILERTNFADLAVQASGAWTQPITKTRETTPVQRPRSKPRLRRLPRAASEWTSFERSSQGPPLGSTTVAKRRLHCMTS